MLVGACGAWSRDRGALVSPEAQPAAHWLDAPAAAAAVLPWGVATLDAEVRHALDGASGSWLVVSGHLLGDRAPDPAAGGATGELLRTLLAHGIRGLRGLQGTFAIAWWDARAGRLILVRDAFGMEPFFYVEREGNVLFGSRIRDLSATGLLAGGLDPQGLLEFLTYCFVPGDATLRNGVRRVPPGTALVIEPGRGVVARERWYALSYARPCLTDEREIATAFRDLLERAVVRQLPPEPVGIFLSGGMDSSSVLTFARRHQPGRIETYAFRCGGVSFDESSYARALADELQTTHTEVEYAEAQALEAEAAAAEMDVPFCDIGIETASWLLATAAGGRVPCVLTGDGGDEFWASHPVYAAQRVLRPYERLAPAGLTRLLSRLATRLPDSDRKRDLRVILKRLLPRDGLPAALGPFRWRVYYTARELADILTPETAAFVRDRDPWRTVLDAFDGYDGADDGLSPFLYNDYVTASSFYFSRLRLLRRFGLEARCPFYDRDLAELGARIPARLKLEGIERTKRLFRVAMEGVLADVINHRTSKLGNSVPLKNWLRGNGPLAAHVSEVLSPQVLRQRGIFRPAAVARMLDDHRRARHNYSHRLWAMYVLELWLRSHEP